MPEEQPIIVDLGMSDHDYLQQLACGCNPVKAYRDQLYQTVLINYGMTAVGATSVAPLIDKLDCSIEEKLVVNQSLNYLWQQLTGQRETHIG
ncbi:hypothetical protein [Stenomitos frigidus]|uniref:Uncharacterized protein n=1 Tax=Stenomitos frigidus ULC18 TaxID=2107698 RepID=A0A2T1DWC5_9CYAN|nr:hypothetical protein [Stenomitos frigidus]PSB24798.1 hypothetical protein C7B82_25675 [Stenomitos frigidus ULC18]